MVRVTCPPENRSDMRGRGDLPDQEWARSEPHLPMNVGRGGRWRSHRRVINGILFRQRTGIPWRDLPTCFGKWKTPHDRHRRWSGDGTWEKILRTVQADADEDGRIDWGMVSVESTSCSCPPACRRCRAAARRTPGGEPTPGPESGWLVDVKAYRQRPRSGSLRGRSGWWARTVSNRRHLLCKSSALPLSYAPVDEGTDYMPHGAPRQSVTRPRAARPKAVRGISPPPRR